MKWGKTSIPADFYKILTGGFIHTVKIHHFAFIAREAFAEATEHPDGACSSFKLPVPLHLRIFKITVVATAFVESC